MIAPSLVSLVWRSRSFVDVDDALREAAESHTRLLDNVGMSGLRMYSVPI